MRTGDTPSGGSLPHVAQAAANSGHDPGIPCTCSWVGLGPGDGQDRATVIVDEIHALAPNKRGSHLLLSLERLDALCGRRLQRIGRAVGDPKTSRDRSSLFGRLPISPGASGVHNCRYRPSPRARFDARSALLAARSRDVKRGVDRSLRSAFRAHPSPSHHVHLCQYPPHGGAYHAADFRAHRNSSTWPRTTAVSARSRGSIPNSA